MPRKLGCVHIVNMSDLLEVVLEDVLHSDVCQLFMSFLEQADQITEIQCSEPFKFSSGNSLLYDQVRIFIDLPDDASLIVKFSSLNIASYMIPSVLLRLVKYGEKYDIDFSFDESDIADLGTIELMKSLYAHISNFSKQYQISDFFGGLEPASDEDTRYFSSNGFGPLLSG